ncbi:alpha/beta fold hydrolase [Gordonia rhizosphera NBRC 16068]|uniref:alpha/beta fold hydrolase n=1 Tax=Gordonia rhizosphera TaxID=83341 RepID=UPI003EDED7A8
MPAIPDPRSALDRVKQEIERNGLRARNGIKMATGVGTPRVGVTPRDAVWRDGRAQLFRYRNDDIKHRTPLMIVFSIISKSYILDLTPGNSFIEHLLKAGFDVYLLDWGVPDERDTRNRLEYYADAAIPAAIREVCARSRVDEVNVLGYCFGGNLTLLHGAHHPDAPIRSHTVVACPVDYSEIPFRGALYESDSAIDDAIGEDGNIPPNVMYSAFRSLKPTSELTGYVDLLDRLWSDEYVAAYQAVNGWVADHIPLPGEVARQMHSMLVAENAFITDRLMLGGDRIHLSDITVPFLSVVGEKDHVVPPASSTPLMDLVGSSQKTELLLKGGHIGLVVGRTAAKTTIPTIIEFLIKQSEAAE